MSSACIASGFGTHHESHPKKHRGSHWRLSIDAFEEKRRSFLFSLGGLGVSQAFPQSLNATRSAAPEGYVLGAAGGEHLVHFRDQGNIFIKAGPARSEE